jgi:hypothetical protein
MEPVSINNNILIKSSSQTSESNIMVKRHGKTTDVYIPFASSNVILFDLQGKKMNSFFIKEPSWKTIPNSFAKGKMSIVQIITKSGEKISVTVK